MPPRATKGRKENADPHELGEIEFLKLVNSEQRNCDQYDVANNRNLGAILNRLDPARECPVGHEE